MSLIRKVRKCRNTEETRRERDTCTPMFTAALFIIARTQCTLHRSKISRMTIYSNPMSLLSSSVDGILQARILEWVARPSSRGSSQLRDQTWVSCIAGGFFTVRATRKALL